MADRTLVADRGDAGRRIDLALRRHLADVEGATRTRVQQWIEEGRVLVNGRAIHRTASRLSAGDLILVALPEPRRRLQMDAEQTALDVLYEDDALLAINKPPGIVVHPTFAHGTGTLMNALLWHARAWPEETRPSLVGRLDKETSGIVLVAKRRAVHAALQRTLASPRSEKDYLALVYGRVKKPRGRIDLALGRAPGDRRRVVASPSGLASLTLFERLDQVAAPAIGLSLLKCRLMTGRMHQIRVHLAARGWPIVGDPKYGSSSWSKVKDETLAAALQQFKRQALHAWRLSFTHPFSNARTTIEAPPPADLQTLLETCGFSPPVS